MEQLTYIIAALILLTSFIFLLQNRIHSMINTFICQSILLATITLLQAIKLSDIELYISASLTIVLKAVFIPYLLRYFVNKLNIRHNMAIIKHPFMILIGASILVIFCYHIENNIISIAMSVMLLGMLLLITHHKAISHVIGFMSMENGILFASLIATNGMPMAIELGIAFDILIAAVLFGIFFLQLRNSIDSLDVDRMNLLREDKE